MVHLRFGVVFLIGAICLKAAFADYEQALEDHPQASSLYRLRRLVSTPYKYPIREVRSTDIKVQPIPNYDPDERVKIQPIPNYERTRQPIPQRARRDVLGEVKQTGKEFKSDDGRTTVNAGVYTFDPLPQIRLEPEIGGNIGIKHELNDRTSVNANAFGNNQRSYRGEVGLTRRLNEHTSVGASAYGNNRDVYGGKMEVRHDFNDRTSVGANVYRDNMGRSGGGFDFRTGF